MSVPQASNHGQLLAERFTQSQYPHIRVHSHNSQHVAIRTDATGPCWSAPGVSSTSFEPWTCQFHKLRTMDSCWLKGSHSHNILTSVSTLTTYSMLRSGQTPKSRVGLHAVSVPQASNHGQLLAERFTQSQHPHIRVHSHHLQHVAIRTDAKVPCWSARSVSSTSFEPWTVDG